MTSLSHMICLAACGLLSFPACCQENAVKSPPAILLPPPAAKGKLSVEEVIYLRKSLREFKDEPLTLPQVSQIMWATGGKTIDGITGPTRSYPSAGGIYPLEIYLVAGKIDGVPSGIYRYEWKAHSLEPLKSGDFRRELARAAWGQNYIARAPASLVITAAVARTSSRYGSRGESRYVPMDVGHSGQNVHLQVRALGLGTVMIGAFNDAEVSGLLDLKGESPFYIIPFGYPR